MWTITKRIEFCAGHRLLQYEGLCSNVHGHNFVAEIHVSGNTLDQAGIMIDFNEFKDSVKAWIDKMWDHAFLVNNYDGFMVEFLEKHSQKSWRLTGRQMCRLHGFSFENATEDILTQLCNPTVENLSLILREVVSKLFEKRGFEFEVTLYESPSGWVTTRS